MNWLVFLLEGTSRDLLTKGGKHEMSYNSVNIRINGITIDPTAQPATKIRKYFVHLSTTLNIDSAVSMLYLRKLAVFENVPGVRLDLFPVDFCGFYANRHITVLFLIPFPFS